MLVTPASLADRLRTLMAALDGAVAGIDDASASRRRDGSWCIKEVLSHLIGENDDFITSVRRFAEEDQPLIEIAPGVTAYDADRAHAGVATLAGGARRQYQNIATYVEMLAPEHLERRALMPGFRDTPLGDRPTLRAWLSAMVDQHVPVHIAQVEAIRRSNGVT